MSHATALRSFACVLILCLLAVPAWGHDESRSALEVFLHDMEAAGDITPDQHLAIERFAWGDHEGHEGHKHGDDEHAEDPLAPFRDYLNGQAFSKRMSRETAEYIKTMFQLDWSDQSFAPVKAGYTGNGNVTRLGTINVDPPSPYYGDNTSTGQLYSGLWGYDVGSREYALQCNSNGLHVIDITNPASAFRVQFIPMAGGRIWRDVQLHEDLPSGKTYAYVGAQSSGNLWVVDLSYLSGTTAHGVDSNPIPPAGYVDRGRTNYGHTVAVHEGLLFMNAAGSNGCQIFDLLADPWNPPLVASWSGSGRDCHDSYARDDVLYSGDGYSRSYRLVDISNVRTTGSTSLIGSTISQSGSYGHSTWLTDDGQYLYGFDEFNVFDISVHDISNPAAPVHVTNFQYSGNDIENSRAHNCQIRGNYLLCGYYEAGFRVFDISNPVNPVEVGKDETWRDPDGDGQFENSISGRYDGGWNVHVFLPSGNVLVADA
jgi:choice-of-anchor B domain-containing protein